MDWRYIQSLVRVIRIGLTEEYDKETQMKKRYIFYTLLVIGLAYLIYYRVSENKKISSGVKGKQEHVKSSALAIEGVLVKPIDFNNKIEVSGSVDANEAVTLHSEVSGLVTQINFKEGGYVKKGALLVKINDRDVQAQLREARTKETLSATTENRAKQLLAKGAISREEYDAALADLQSLKAQSQLIKAQLAKTEIYAPFSGRIGLRSISAGGYVTPATEIANLLSVNPVKITFAVPEKYVELIGLNSIISLSTAASNDTFSGKVYAIEPGINTQTRTLSIKALASNPDGKLLPGSFAQVKVNLNTLKNAILVPTEAIVPVLDGKTVFVSRNGKAQQIKVEAGIRTSRKILITKGLIAGDTVLTTGILSLKNDVPVKVKITSNTDI
ncbi:membrane fusion protein (multidrug efflux system) [Pedobacter sp. UYEF25]